MAEKNSAATVSRRSSPRSYAIGSAHGASSMHGGNEDATSYESFRRRFGGRIGESVLVHPKTLALDERRLRVPTYIFFCVAESLGY
ncbi:hypothetical protein [Curtanaerobium respiraculi]|uniref:hypothetical protein n=1 Tax=Curtanaerobium respiraculi TaxID=2949669 RepID=UPI0024B37CC6|nr:hypothetical protein [Curtanaerobium respiraculi]